MAQSVQLAMRPGGDAHNTLPLTASARNDKVITTDVRARHWKEGEAFLTVLLSPSESFVQFVKSINSVGPFRPKSLRSRGLPHATIRLRERMVFIVLHATDDRRHAERPPGQRNPRCPATIPAADLHRAVPRLSD